MAELFPRGYIGLKEWIEREAGIRFGPMSPQSQTEQSNTILDELSLKLAARESSIAVAISKYGHQQPAPAFIWQRSEAERRKMLQSGSASFNAGGQWIPWRIGILAAFTLVPKQPAPRVQMSEAERIARQAEGQRRAGISIGSLAGSAPDLATRPERRAVTSPASHPAKTGLPGRPSQAAWIIAEHERRCAKGIALLTLEDEAQAISAWLRAAHPGQAHYATLKTIKNRIRARHREFKNHAR